jgi:hypothetical protein
MPAAVESGRSAARSGLLLPPTGRIWPPHATRRRLTAMRRLTADGDEPQSDLQAHCLTGAVRPLPRN